MLDKDCLDRVLEVVTNDARLWSKDLKAEVIKVLGPFFLVHALKTIYDRCLITGLKVYL